MAGFYGSVVSAAKTPFSYDLIYSTRYAMDAAISDKDDGVFLGRYVLVEYDSSTIRGYFDKTTNKFYRDAEKTELMSGEENVIYQNLLEVSGFYRYSNTTKTWTKDTSGANSAYEQNYMKDVQKYGRGYDSTVWIKHYDVTTNKYHYLLMAELNATTPTFHLIHDAPKEIPEAPYFDDNSSNLDYYLHHEVNFTNTIKSIDDDHPYSDVRVTKPVITWSYSGNQETASKTDETVEAAIYFNQAGFNKAERSYKTDGKAIDSFGYTLSQSGRRYAAPTLGGTGTTADDTKNWYWYLPSLGNTICELWDDIYGQERKLTIPTKINQENVNYDTNTIFGFCNTVRDLIGYTLKEKGSTPNTKTEIDNSLYHENGKYYYYAPNIDGTLYTLKEIPEAETTVYGLITTIHRLMGTGETLTTPTTIISCLNKMKELLAKFDEPFTASKLVCTDASGKITSSDTDFPILNNTQVLQGSGIWKYVSEMNLNGYLSSHNSTLVQEQYSINKAFDEVTGAIEKNKNDLASEVSRSTTEGQTLLSAINAEVSRADTAEKANASLIDTENKRATAAEGALDNRITSEVSTLNNAISAETTRAQGEEQKNANAIAAETSRATEAEGKNAQAISAEQTRAEKAEGENKSAIEAQATKVQENTTAISNEVSRAKEAEQTNASAIATEKERAEAAEKVLNDRLDAIDEKNYDSRINTLENAKYGDSISSLNTTVSELSNTVSAHTTTLTGMSNHESRIATIENAYISESALTILKNAIWADLQSNFDIGLKEPVCTVGLAENGNELTIAYGSLPREQLTVNLEYKNEEGTEFTVAESAPAQDKDTFTMTQNGTYRIHIVRTHNGFTSEWTSTDHVYTVATE